MKKSILVIVILIMAISGFTDAQAPEDSPQLYALEWSPDGSKIAGGFSDGTLTVWDAVTHNELMTQQAHTDVVWALAWSPDSNRLASGGRDPDIKVWDIATQQLAATLVGNELDVGGLGWSPDGTKLASVAIQDALMIWDMANYRLLNIFDSGGSYGIAWSPDGTRLIGINLGGAIIRDPISGERLFTLDPEEDAINVAAQDLTPSGDKLVFSGTVNGDLSNQGKLWVWDVNTRQLLYSLEEHTDIIFAVRWSPDAKQLVSGSADGTLRFWDTATGENTQTIVVGSTVYAIAFSPDGSQLVYGGEDGELKFINMPTSSTDLNWDDLEVSEADNTPQLYVLSLDSAFVGT